MKPLTQTRPTQLTRLLIALRCRLALWRNYLRARVNRLSDEQVLLINMTANAAKGLILLVLSTVAMGIAAGAALAFIPGNLSPQDQGAAENLTAMFAAVAVLGLHIALGPSIKKFINAPLVPIEGRPPWKFPTTD